MDNFFSEIDENTWKKAADLFERNEESLNEDVDTIKSWLKTQPHLPEIMDDKKIKNFLLLNKCSIEKSKQKIDMYYTIRSLIPDFYDNCNPNLPHMKELMECTYFCLFPKLVDGLYRVYYVKVKLPNKYLPKEIFMQLTNIQEIRLSEDCMVGDIFVVDMCNFTINDLTKVTPTLLAKITAVYQNVYSVRTRATYFINSPSYIGKLMTVIKALVKPKIFSRIHALENAEILNQVFSKEYIPKDYGGDGPSLDELQEMMKLKLFEYQNRFNNLDQLRVNEKLRPEKLDNDEILGFHGNFKKLTVD